jgi:sulfite reductase alpha subunit-like flavoprotein
VVNLREQPQHFRADPYSSIDGAFLPWSLDFKSQLLEKYPIPDGVLPIPDSDLLPPKWTLELAKSSNDGFECNEALYRDTLSVSDHFEAMDDPITGDMCIKGHAVGPDEIEPFDYNLPPDDLLPIPNSQTAVVRRNVSLTPSDHWQDVRHVDLFINNNIDYRPGDCVSIYPKNFPEDVDSLINLMDWTAIADTPLTYVPTAGSFLEPTYVPALYNLYTTSPPTLRSLLLHNLDITAIPRRFFFEVLAKFTSDPMHRERLLEFTNPAYTDEFFDYTTRPRRSILEVLHDFPSVRLPWRWAPYIFPTLRPRQFSISSGGRLKHPDEASTTVHICVAIVKYRTVLKKVRQGVCSRYIASLQAGTQIRVTFQRGSFKVSGSQARKPLLMIAPGTGLAPMRSLIWERAMWRDNLTEESSLPGEAVLIYGGRNSKKDFLYHQDWQMRDLEVKVLTAWSRDQKEKIYVQDVVRREAEMVWRLLVQEGGSVFVCGSSGKMPTGVRAAIVDAFVVAGNKLDVEYSQERAEEELSRIEKEGRYVQETW